MKDADFVANRYRAETDWQSTLLANPELSTMAETWFRTDTVDAWRHRRMYECLNPLLQAHPDSRWLTVGDARYGTDAHYIQSQGHSVLATNISDELLKISVKRGFIRECQAENAEHLSFADNSFDFVFCKETYHHLPRPMLALYEMLRVAKEGVVLIEPQEAPLLRSPASIGKRLVYWTLRKMKLGSLLPSADPRLVQRYDDSWEEVGNYLYRISEREMEKAALGMGYSACAFKGINDHYEKGVEYEAATSDSKMFQRVQQQIGQWDRQCRDELGFYAPGLLVAVIFKRPPAPAVVALLQKAGFRVKDLPQNPYAAAQSV